MPLDAKLPKTPRRKRRAPPVEMPQAKVPGTRDVMERPKTRTQERQRQKRLLDQGFERL